MLKKRVILPSNDAFKYHAVIWCWELLGNNKNKSEKKVKKPSIVRVNVGGKTFRLRDDNLKTGLLADPYEKREGIGRFICCC